MRMITHSVQLPMTMLRERQRYVAYTPALDLSTSGKTFAEAKRRFAEAVDIFFEEIIERGTLEVVLTDLGWHKEQHQWRAPIIVGQETKAIHLPVR